MSPSRLGIIATVCAAALSGCVFNQSADLSPELRTAFETPLICNGEAECKLMWERATYYVSSNSRWRMVALTENLIETDSVPRGNSSLSYSIVREPMGEGRYRLAMSAWCGVKDFACKPHADEGVARAKRYIATGQR